MLSPWERRACVQGFLNRGFPSQDFLTLQSKFCYDAEGNSSLIPLVRKGARSSVVFSAENLSFQLSYPFTGFVRWLFEKNVLREDRVLYSKVSGAECGMTFPCIQLDCLRYIPGSQRGLWPVLSPQLCAGVVWESAS